MVSRTLFWSFFFLPNAVINRSVASTHHSRHRSGRVVGSRHIWPYRLFCRDGQPLRHPRHPSARNGFPAQLARPFPSCLWLLALLRRRSHASFHRWCHPCKSTLWHRLSRRRFQSENGRWRERKCTGAKPKAKPAASSIKVAYAKEWGKSRNDFVAPATEFASNSKEVQGTATPGSSASHFGGNATDITAAKDYDWTYSTTWPGSTGDIAPQPLLPTQVTPTLAAGLKPLSQSVATKEDGGGWWTPGTDPARDRIPVERLGPSSGEPILFYDDIVLFEDELADNGSSIVNVKVRVMPSGFLVLQRFFLRVDDVVFRVFDTRLYCQFEPASIPRGPASTALPTNLNQLNLGAPRTTSSSAAAARPRLTAIRS